MLSGIIRLIRIHNWLKNSFVILPVVFSLKMNVSLLTELLTTFLAFSFCSSFVYILNDYMDREADRLHPVKRNRPIASGLIGGGVAFSLAMVLLISALLMAFKLPSPFLLIMLVYLGINMAYTFFLKHVSIIDCFCIASGFVLRVLAGCAVIDVVASDWIITVTFFLALFLAFSKRKSEMLLLSESSNLHRRSLDGYSTRLLDIYIFISATVGLTGYLLYTFSQSVIQQYHNESLKYSAIFVVFGFFRYFQIIEGKEHGKDGDPTTVLLTDIRLQLAVVSWLLYVCWAIYG